MTFRVIRGFWYVRIFNLRYPDDEILRSLKIKGKKGQKPSPKVKNAGQKLYNQLLLEQKQNKAQKPQNKFGATCDELMEKFFTLKAIGYKDQGKNARYQVRSFLSFFANYRLWEIDRETMLKYKKARMEAGRKNSTINRELQVFRTALYFCVKEKLIKRNEALDVIDLFDLQSENEFIRNRNPRSHELRKLVFNMEIHSAIAIMIESVSMNRKGAALSAKWTDVQWANRRLMVGKTKNGDPIYTPLAINCLNGSVNFELLKILKVWQRYQADLHKEKGYPAPEYIITWRGKDIKDNKKAFGTARAKAELTDIKQHDFRHFGITLFKRIGHDENIIKKGSGHKTNSAFRRYLDYDENAIDEMTGISESIVQKPITCDEFIRHFRLERYRFAINELYDILGEDIAKTG